VLPSAGMYGSRTIQVFVEIYCEEAERRSEAGQEDTCSGHRQRAVWVPPDNCATQARGLESEQEKGTSYLEG